MPDREDDICGHRQCVQHGESVQSTLPGFQLEKETDEKDILDPEVIDNDGENFELAGFN